MSLHNHANLFAEELHKLLEDPVTQDGDTFVSTVNDDSVMGQLLTIVGSTNYDRTEASLEAISDRQDVPSADAVTNLHERDVVGNKTDTNAGDSIYANLLVPTADAATNISGADVIGNKTDTNAGDSIYANLLVPVTNTVANVIVSEVVGSKLDTNAGDSLYALEQVPTADVVTNVTVRDVVGNKADIASEAVGASVIALLRRLVETGVEEVTTTDGEATAVNITSELTVLTIAIGAASQQTIHALFIDIGDTAGAGANAVSANAKVFVKMYADINGTEVEVYDEEFRKDRDPDGLWLVTGQLAVASDLRVTMESNDAGDIAVDLPFTHIVEELT